MKGKLHIWAIVIAAATLFGLTTSEIVKAVEKQQSKAKYIFLFIGDGMGATHAAAAESYLSYKKGKFGGERLSFTDFPAYGSVTTYSANRPITCSSASGTAIACGAKTNNGMVGMDKDSVNLKSVACVLKEMGYNIGIMSNVPINHATPSAFYAHNISRNNYYEISRDIASSGFEFFAGPGFLEYDGKNNDKPATDIYLKKKGYVVSYGMDEFNKESKKAKKIILCQESSRKKGTGNYTNEAKNKEDFSLEQMVDAALGYLGDKEPFFIMCEGGNIDWAAHSNLTMPMVKNILDFNEAVQRALKFYEEHKDETLIIVTADHETGGITLGAGKSKKLDWKTLEKQWIENGYKNTLSKEENKELNNKCSFGWTTTSHTGGPVPIYAIGKGSERFIGRLDNTEIKPRILAE